MKLAGSIHEWEMETNHVHGVEANFLRSSCRNAIVDTGTNDEIVSLFEHLA